MIRFFRLYFLLFLTFLLTCPTAFGADDGAAHHDFGVFSFESGDYKTAEKWFKLALESEPENSVYNHDLGKIYLKTGQYEKAVEILQKALDKTPDSPDLKYDTGYAFFKAENHEKAAEFLTQVADLAPDDALANYHAGLSLYKMERFDEAPKYLSRAAELSPSLRPRANYVIGSCFQKQEKMEQALEMFSKVRDDPEAADMKYRAISRIAAIKKLKKRYRLYAKLGVRYDDNVRLDPVDKDLSEKDQDDMVYVLTFSGNYDFFRKGGYSIGAGYTHYQSKHDSLGEYDLTGSSAKLYAKYKTNPLTFQFSFLPSYYWLDSESYSRKYGFKPEVRWKINKAITANMYYQYTDIHNFDDNAKSGNSHRMYIDARTGLGKLPIFFTAGAGGEILDASGAEDTYHSWRAKVGLTFKLPEKFDLKLGGEFQDREYDVAAGCKCEVRRDHKWSGTVSVSRPLVYEWLDISVDYGFTRRNSNYVDKQYERNKAAISLTAKF